MIRRLAILALGGCLVSCTVFRTDVDPVATYTLEVPEGRIATSVATADGVMEVRTPLPAPGFATVRMIYQRNDYQHEAFAYAQWVDTLPSLLRTCLMDTLDALGRFEVVVAAPSPEPPHYRIETRDLYVLQRFEDGEATSDVEISFRARVVDARERELLGARVFRARAAAAPSPQGGVAAANEAMGEVMADLSDYLLELLGT